MIVRPQTLAWSVMAFLAAGVGLVSLRYALPAPPVVPPDVAANAFAAPFLVLHAVTAALALVIGAFQFVRRKTGRRARWHRASGGVYMACCLLAAPSGLVLALGSTAGPIATAGFGLLALVWAYVTAQGLTAVLQRRYADHARWMVRSYALTLAAVTLRLYLPIPHLMGIDFADGYRAIAFLCWVPNLIAAELWLAARRRPLTTSAPA